MRFLYYLNLLAARITITSIYYYTIFLDWALFFRIFLKFEKILKIRIFANFKVWNCTCDLLYNENIIAIISVSKFRHFRENFQTGPRLGTAEPIWLNFNKMLLRQYCVLRPEKYKKIIYILIYAKSRNVPKLQNAQKMVKREK